MSLDYLKGISQHSRLYIIWFLKEIQDFLIQIDTASNENNCDTIFTIKKGQSSWNVSFLNGKYYLKRRKH